MDKLTDLQQNFIKLYNGNATETAIKAGYSKQSAHVQGSRLMRNKKILKHLKIKDREIRRPSQLDILSRDERLAFWSSVVLDSNEAMLHRLRASELLGRAFADFTDVVQGNVSFTPVQLLNLIDERRKNVNNVVNINVAQENKECKQIEGNMPESMPTPLGLASVCARDGTETLPTKSKFNTPPDTNALQDKVSCVEPSIETTFKSKDVSNDALNDTNSTVEGGVAEDE